jgi:hypothetical protein
VLLTLIDEPHMPYNGVAKQIEGSGRRPGSVCLAINSFHWPSPRA